MAQTAGPDDVSGSKVSGATSVDGGTGGVSGAVAGLADDVASQNAANANRVPRGTGEKITYGRMYGKGSGGQTQGGY
jgi:hypothetical protein